MTTYVVSQLARIELLTPRPQESLDFFTGTIGLCESACEGQSVYLRGSGDCLHHGVVLTGAAHSGPGRIRWLNEGSEALEVVVSRLEAIGSATAGERTGRYLYFREYCGIRSSPAVATASTSPSGSL